VPGLVSSEGHLLEKEPFMTTRTASAKRRGLKEKPLPLPGQSASRQMQDLVFDRLLPYLLIALFAVLLALMEWIRWMTKAPLSPMTYTIIAVGAGIAAFLQYRKLRPLIAQYRLGRDGERAVGQALEKLRPMGYGVFHDVPGDSFNVDHVIVGPTGVYAIETKTLSKRGGEEKITTDGKYVYKNGLRLDRNPIHQARAEADYVKSIVSDALDRDVAVRPVVLFPEWWVVEVPKSLKMWLLNPKSLPSFLEQERPVLSPDEVKQIASAIESHSRNWVESD
jgi:hypothetical protein